jgi:hypothetical protein
VPCWKESNLQALETHVRFLPGRRFLVLSYLTPIMGCKRYIASPFF